MKTISLGRYRMNGTRFVSSCMADPDLPKPATFADVAAALRELCERKRIEDASSKKLGIFDTNSSSLATLNRRERTAMQEVIRRNKEFWVRKR